MAALKENLLSPYHFNETGDALNSYRQQREESIKKSQNRRMGLHGDLLNFQRDKHLSQAVHLQQRWQELKDRERRAQQRNKQLLEDFDRAQDTIKEMVNRMATMNTIRDSVILDHWLHNMRRRNWTPNKASRLCSEHFESDHFTTDSRLEYERYLEESTPRWQQQLQEKTLAAEKRIEERFKAFLKKRQHEQPSFPRECFSTPQDNTHRPQRPASVLDSANGCPDTFAPPATLSISSSWLSPAQMSHTPLHVLQQLHHQTALQQGPPPPSWATSPQTSWPPPLVSSLVGLPTGLNTSWAPAFMPGPSGVVQGMGTGAVGGRAPSAEDQSESRGGGSDCLSQELDIKPVGLSSSHGDSSESSRDSGSGKNSRGRRMRWEGKRQHSYADKKRGSHESADTSSAVVIATTSAAKGARASKGRERGVSSGTERNCSTGRSGGRSVQEQRKEKKPRVRTSSNSESIESRKVKSPTLSEESSSHVSEDESLGDQSEGCRKEFVHRKEESVSVAVKTKTGRIKAGPERSGAAGERTGEVGGKQEPGETIKDDEHIIKDQDVSGNDKIHIGEDDSEEGSQENENKEVEEESGEEETSQENENKEVEEESGEETSQENENKEVEEESGEETSQVSENKEVEEESGEETSQENENKEVEEESGEETEGQESNASEEEGYCESSEQGESENEEESSSVSQGQDKQEMVEEFQLEAETEEAAEDVDGGKEEVGSKRTEQGSQAGKSEESDSEDCIISPQEHRSIKKVQSISEEETDSDEEGDKLGGSEREHSEELSNEDSDDEGDDIERLAAPQAEAQRKKKVQSISEEETDSDEEGDKLGGSEREHSEELSNEVSDDEGDDIERLTAPQAEAQRKEEKEPISRYKIKEIKKYPESLTEEQDKEIKMEEDTNSDEFDDFYD